jgi:hypothetical protein
MVMRWAMQLFARLMFAAIKNSPYAKATLGAGEQYVLQIKADPITKNVAGYWQQQPRM